MISDKMKLGKSILMVNISLETKLKIFFFTFKCLSVCYSCSYSFIIYNMKLDRSYIHGDTSLMVMHYVTTLTKYSPGTW